MVTWKWGIIGKCGGRENRGVQENFWSQCIHYLGYSGDVMDVCDLYQKMSNCMLYIFAVYYVSIVSQEIKKKLREGTIC